MDKVDKEKKYVEKNGGLEKKEGTGIGKIDVEGKTKKKTYL